MGGFSEKGRWQDNMNESDHMHPGIKKELSFRPELIVYDFDGVMTDNRVMVDETGKESVTVHRGDGTGVKLIREQLNIPQIILSTEVNPVVLRRAEKLKIPVINNAGDSKAEILQVYCKKHGYHIGKTLYVGNDVNDYDAMECCGYKVCPADAEREIKKIADYIIPVQGGYGVVRALYRFLMEGDHGTENS